MSFSLPIRSISMKPKKLFVPPSPVSTSHFPSILFTFSCLTQQKLKSYGLGLCFPFSENLQGQLSTTSDEAWKEREAAVLALGAIAEGCITGLFPHLPEVYFSFLILIPQVIKWMVICL